MRLRDLLQGQQRLHGRTSPLCKGLYAKHQTSGVQVRTIAATRSAVATVKRAFFERDGHAGSASETASRVLVLVADREAQLRGRWSVQRLGIHPRVANRIICQSTRPKNRSGEAASRRGFSGAKHIRPHDRCNALLDPPSTSRAGGLFSDGLDRSQTPRAERCCEEAWQRS